jgi:CheY-like chemotaxis protein
MKILIVEDDPTYLNTLREGLADIVGAEVIFARSRDAGVSAIEAEHFDLAILDLKVPTIDDALDAEVAHGRAVYAHLREHSPGTPVCFLTGFATEDFFTEILQDAEKVDIWGSGDQFPLVQNLRKTKLSDAIAVVRNVSDQVRLTDEVEVNSIVDLSGPETRVVKIFARRTQAALVQVRELSGGLSAVHILELRMRSSTGATRLVCAARLGDRPAIKAELAAYQTEVIRLRNGSYSPLAGDVFFGASRMAGAFYRLIEDYQTIAERLREDPTSATQLVAELRTIEGDWTSGVPAAPRQVKSIRQIAVTDPVLATLAPRLNGINIAEFERRQASCRLCTQHRDLHLSNILVGPHNQPILIDFASVGSAPASFDPVTLELSLLFHPVGRSLVGDWPSPEAAENWLDIETYVRNCPAAELVRACREWALAVGAGRRELLASLYAISVRQLQYADTNKELAQALIRCAIREFART